jgi:hypothetical protein
MAITARMRSSDFVKNIELFLVSDKQLQRIVQLGVLLTGMIERRKVRKTDFNGKT